MQVTNLKNLEQWLDQLWNSGYVFLRYNEYPTKDLEMNWEQELIKHAKCYEQDTKHFTFHHIRLLFDNLKSNKIKHPLVGTYWDNNIQVNPGGSRLMVAKKLQIPIVPLDLICQEKDKPTNQSNILVKTVEQFVEPFLDIDSKAKIDLETDTKFCYEINFQKDFHWTQDDIEQWLDQKQHIKCSNPMDYYFI